MATPRESHEPAQIAAEPPPLLTPREVRRRLNVSRATLDGWCSAGFIAFVRLPSGHRRYRKADIEKIERGES